VIFSFTSPLNPTGHDEFNKHVAKHGDGVKDVAFSVDDSEAIFKKAVSRGAVPLLEPTTWTEVIDGKESIMKISSVKTYGDVSHTFVEREKFSGTFWPGFQKHYLTEPINDLLPAPKLV
jgi:4-hydroxyphenylpyruvate dioxygenase